jgi:hypothetical protein
MKLFFCSEETKKYPIEDLELEDVLTVPQTPSFTSITNSEPQFADLLLIWNFLHTFKYITFQIMHLHLFFFLSLKNEEKVDKEQRNVSLMTVICV